MEQSRKVSTILNCFVDMNLETNERFPYDVQLLSVSFGRENYVVDENATLTVTVVLDQPSTQGIEEADLIFSHITTGNDDMDLSAFPVRLKWEIGEQTKTIQIPVSRDFVEDENEELLLGLTNLCNLRIGSFAQTNVLVVDRTALRTVNILAASPSSGNDPMSDPNARKLVSSTQGGAGGATIHNTISFTVVEGEQLAFTVGLNKPSQFGVERVDITISNVLDTAGLTTPPSVLLSVNALEWNVGEQYKTVTISAARNGFLQGSRKMLLELRNPIATKFDVERNSIEVIIQDPPIARRYVSIDIGRIFKQKGSDIVPPAIAQNTEVHLRAIADGQMTQQGSMYWLVEMGTYYVDESNNAAIGEPSNYDQWPNYYFGTDANGNATGVYLRVTNLGIGEITHRGNTYGVGESFNITLSRGASTITLPTNDVLQPAGSISSQDNLTLQDPTFMECHYKLEIVIDIPQLQVQNENYTSGPHGFILKSNGQESNAYVLGEFTLNGYSSAQESLENVLGLYSSYSNMRTRFNGSVCSNTYDGPDRVFDVRINGLILLSMNSLGTDYISHEIIPVADMVPVCGTSSGNSGGMPWASIPFEIAG